MIISINGMDNCGKTTQTRRLIELYPDLFIRKIHIADTTSFDKAGYDYDWWFRTSTPEEFTHALYSSLAERIAIARSIDSSDKIVIMEKGLEFYDARILSTLLAKGLSLEEAALVQKGIRDQYDLEDVEKLKLYLKPGSYRRKSDLDDDPLYQSYLYNNQRILEFMDPDYVFIEPGPVDVVTNNILVEIERRMGDSGKERVLFRNTCRLQGVH